MKLGKLFLLAILTTAQCNRAMQATTDVLNGLPEDHKYYVIRMYTGTGDHSIIFAPEVVREMDSKLINRLLDNVGWCIECQMIDPKTEKTTRAAMARKITLPALLDHRSMYTLKKMTDNLGDAWLTVPERWDKVRGAMHTFIEQAYQRSYLVPIVRLHKALDALESDKLTAMYREEIEAFKNDERFNTGWAAAVQKIQAQKETTTIKTGDNAASKPMHYEQIVHITGTGYDAVWSGDGRRLAITMEPDVESSCYTCKTDVYNTETGNRLGTFPGWACALSQDGSQLLTAYNTDIICTPFITLFDVSSRHERYTCTVPLGREYRPRFSLDGNKILLNSDTNEVQILDAINLEPLRAVKVCCGLLGPDGSRAIARATCTYMALIDTTTQMIVAASPGAHGEFSPDGSKVAFGGTSDSTVSVFDAKTGDQLGEFDGGAVAAFSSDSERLATVITEDANRKKPYSIIYDVATERRLGTMPGTLQQFLPGNNNQALILTSSGEAGIYDLTLDQLVYELGKAKNARFSPDGSRLFVIDDTGIKILKLCNN